jgi:hypothetical protein
VFEMTQREALERLARWRCEPLPLEASTWGDEDGTPRCKRRPVASRRRPAAGSAASSRRQAARAQRAITIAGTAACADRRLWRVSLPPATPPLASTHRPLSNGAAACAGGRSAGPGERLQGLARARAADAQPPGRPAAWPTPRRARAGHLLGPSTRTAFDRPAGGGELTVKNAAMHTDHPTFAADPAAYRPSNCWKHGPLRLRNATCRLPGPRRRAGGPRGRIWQIRQLLGASADHETQLHLDRCLTCRSCESTCPSGVEYGRIVGPVALVERTTGRQHARNC